MPVFICSRCGCIDNSACDNNYWNVAGKMRLYERKIFNEAMVCTSCVPKGYDIKNPDDKYKPCNEWHNRFEKQNIKDSKYTKEELIQLAKSDKHIYENVIEYFDKYENMTIEEFDKLAEEREEDAEK